MLMSLTNFWFCRYLLFITNNSVKFDNIGVSELGHDGCLLQKLDFIGLIRSI